MARQLGGTWTTLTHAWQRIAAPPRPTNLYSLSQAQQDRWRRGTILSSSLAVLLLGAVITLFGVWTNLVDTALILAAIGVFAGCVWLNKRGYTYLAGMLIILVMGIGVIDAAMFYYAEFRGGLAPINFLPMMLWPTVLVVAWLILPRALAIISTFIGVGSVLIILFFLPKSPSLFGEIARYVSPMPPVGDYLYVLIHPICMTLFVFFLGWQNQTIRTEMTHEAAKQGEFAEEQRRIVLYEQGVNEYFQIIFAWMQEVVAALANHRPLPTPPAVPDTLRSVVARLEHGVVPLIDAAMRHAETQRQQLLNLEAKQAHLVQSVSHVTATWEALARDLPELEWPRVAYDAEHGGVLTSPLLRIQGTIDAINAIDAALDPHIVHMLHALSRCEDVIRQELRGIEAQQWEFAHLWIDIIARMQRGERVQLPSRERAGYQQTALGPLNDVSFALNSLLQTWQSKPYERSTPPTTSSLS